MSLRPTIRSTAPRTTIRKGIDSLAAGGPDPDATLWINARVAAGDALTTPQKLAVDTFVKAEKAAGRWTLLKRLYLFTALNNPAANGIDMVTRAVGTFTGSITHSVGFSQGVSSPVFNTGVSPSTLGLTTSGGGMGVLHLGGDAGTTPNVFIGCQNSSSQSSFFHWTTSPSLRLNYNDSGTALIASAQPMANTVGVISAHRYAGNRSIYRRNAAGHSTLGTAATANGGVIPIVNMYVMSLNNNGSTSSYSLNKFGAAFVCLGWDTTADAAFSLNLKTLWEALSGLTLP